MAKIHGKITSLLVSMFTLNLAIFCEQREVVFSFSSRWRPLPLTPLQTLFKYLSPVFVTAAHCITDQRSATIKSLSYGIKTDARNCPPYTYLTCRPLQMESFINDKNKLQTRHNITKEMLSSIITWKPGLHFPTIQVNIFDLTPPKGVDKPEKGTHLDQAQIDEYSIGDLYTLLLWIRLHHF